MKILVCGGRDYKDKQKLFDCLSRMHDVGGDPWLMEITHLIHGGATGADSYASEWAMANTCHDGTPIFVSVYHAQWDKHGRSAGSIRNQQMLDEGKPQMVVAFPGGIGTADMVSRAAAAGLPVVKVDG